MGRNGDIEVLVTRPEFQVEVRHDLKYCRDTHDTIFDGIRWFLPIRNTLFLRGVHSAPRCYGRTETRRDRRQGHNLCGN
jgi:hypothetical protein